MSHRWAVLQALLVTFLWSTSWVFIKLGLEDIPSLIFAGLRYSLATIFLILLLVSRKQTHLIKTLTRKDWLSLGALGVIYYTLTQGAQFVALDYLPAITTNILLSFTTIVVTLLGIRLLAEIPTTRQWGGMAVYLLGVVIYFHPIDIPAQELIGLGVALIGVMANAGGAILGRYINRTATLSPLVITVVSMGIGSSLLLASGIITQGLPTLSLENWLIVVWLALVNTAFAFTLWNHTLRTLSAMESSIINNTMTIQIPILALIFLGETIDLKAGIGMVLAGLGIFAVQIYRQREVKK